MKRIILIITEGLIILAALFVLSNKGCAKGSPKNYEPAPDSRSVRAPLVVSYHEIARAAGYRVLNSGGNAFDAYIAVTMVENVVSSGYVTLAGLLSTLIYHAGTGKTVYLDGGYNSVLHPEGTFDYKNPVIGKMVVVPGVVAGLAAISKRYGRLSFAKVLQPAIEIAQKGFVIDEREAGYIKTAARKLKSTEYGRRTYFPEGTPLQAGEILKQPELAEFLGKLAHQGAGYMYEGEWAARCVAAVNKAGGRMTLKDLASYRPTWTRPWKISYRGFDIHASSGRSMLALWTLLALKTLEHTDIQSSGHFSVSADALEILVRTARAVQKEQWIKDYRCLDDRELVNSRLTSNYTAGIWAKVKGELSIDYPQTPPGHHTLSSIIADKEGSVVCGKHSINSELWGTGIFVQGVLLNGSGDMTGRFTGLGQRRTQGAANFIIFKNGDLKYACGTFSFSNPQAAFQFLVNILDYGLPPDRAVELPRFGSFPIDQSNWTVDVSKNWLDQRVSPGIVAALKARGIFFSQEKPLLGKGCIAEFFPDGSAAFGWDKDN